MALEAPAGRPAQARLLAQPRPDCRGRDPQ
jgi:hypothetical protein